MSMMSKRIITLLLILAFTGAGLKAGLRGGSGLIEPEKPGKTGPELAGPELAEPERAGPKLAGSERGGSEQTDKAHWAFTAPNRPQVP